MLKEIGRRTRERTGTTQLSAEDYMDDGAKLCLTVNIDEEKVMDFKKTFLSVFVLGKLIHYFSVEQLGLCAKCIA